MRSHRSLLGTLTLSLVVVSAAAAQGKVNFGVLGGAAFSKVSGDAVGSDVKTHVGIAAGAFATIAATPNVAIEPGLLFVQKGGKEEDTQAGSTTTLKLTYIEAPLLLKIRAPPKSGGLVSPHIYAGPALAFKVSCRIKGTDGTITLSANCDEQPFDFKVKSTDFSVVFGGGVDVGRAMIDVRYDLGLSKIGPSSDPDVKNRTFYLLAGWTFRSPR
jgi:Outer membrane protein beta-barrel domain